MSKKIDIPIKDYREILSTLNLEDISLLEGGMKLRKDKLGKQLELAIKETSKYEIENNNLIVNYKSVFKGLNEETKEAGVTITAFHEIIYSLSGEKEVTPEFMDKFAQYSISITIWPFFREFVQNMVSKAHLPPLTLPLKKLV